ncbi:MULTISPECIES: N-acetyl-gamma-glutamyl-phosphate reductase [Bacillaceae]|uniref:N-acetyl-gamma-glutamyl-phosphate reductase n=1 Tax=Evansella alkalicola TaxID=745819 RepID=A0ABS6JWQ8_9BACI|nr:MULTISPECIES: N-acetyl-gamma-glutamyl-phosphate reductase [Bacillaceae]MBU9723026.1 N-acetyl-gamma-glutamyl-phosphate reductase [Bacillus alkalicola]
MKSAIIGGTGYGAVELVRLLDKHPNIELVKVISNSQSGTDIQDVYPHLSNILNIQLSELNIQSLCEEVDVVFFATPAGVSKEYIPELHKQGVKCIDLSGDFRLKNPQNYETWYGKSSAETTYLEKATYGLSEIYGDDIKNSEIIANPGCYPTAALLGLIPAINNKMIDPKTIIIDGKSGVSGAGRGVSLNTHYSEINENLKAYKLGQHQHIPEIEQAIEWSAAAVAAASANHAELESIPVSFSTHLTPMTRGIMCTMYAQLTDPSSATVSAFIEHYESFYESHPFVRIRPEGTWPSTKEVSGSNYCDIGFQVDARTGRVTIVSVIDNLMKGAAGQAVQNLNLMNGWDVQMGLTDIPMYP